MKEDTIPCNFCDNTNYSAKLLIAGNGGVHICDKCIDLAYRVSIYNQYRIVALQGTQDKSKSLEKEDE